MLGPYLKDTLFLIIIIIIIIIICHIIIKLIYCHVSVRCWEVTEVRNRKKKAVFQFRIIRVDLVVLAEGGIPSLHISPHRKDCLRRGEACNIALPVKTTILCYSFTGGQSARLVAYFMCINVMTSDTRRADMLVPWDIFFFCDKIVLPIVTVRYAHGIFQIFI
jgi:hypothetical protein